MTRSSVEQACVLIQLRGVGLLKSVVSGVTVILPPRRTGSRSPPSISSLEVTSATTRGSTHTMPRSWPMPSHAALCRCAAKVNDLGDD
jgi:hypothetical protein